MVTRHTCVHRRTRPAALEAVWIATQHALYYVTPRLEAVSRWPWDLLTLDTVKTGRRSSRLTLTPAGDTPLVARVPGERATNLRVIAHHRGAARALS